MRFQDIATIPERDMPAICRELPVDTLSRSLVNSNLEFVTGILKHIRPDIVDLVRDLMKKHEKLGEAEVESARARMLAIIEKAIAK